MTELHIDVSPELEPQLKKRISTSNSSISEKAEVNIFSPTESNPQISPKAKRFSKLFACKPPIDSSSGPYKSPSSALFRSRSQFDLASSAPSGSNPVLPANNQSRADLDIALMEKISHFAFFRTQGFDPQGERDVDTLNVRDNVEYRGYLSEVLRRCAVKEYCRGDVIYHDGNNEALVCFVVKGKVGNMVRCGKTERDNQKAEIDKIMRSQAAKDVKNWNEERIRSELQFEKKDELLRQLNELCLIDSEYRKLMFLLCNTEKAGIWTKEQLYLLCCSEADRYFDGNLISHWMKETKEEGDVLGDYFPGCPVVPRQSTVVVLSEDLSLLVIDRYAFEEVCLRSYASQDERIKFFMGCFPAVLKRTLINFDCLFTKVQKNRGDLLTKAGSPANTLYLIEDGEVAIVYNPDFQDSKKAKSERKSGKSSQGNQQTILEGMLRHSNGENSANTNQLSSMKLIITVGKFGFIGDELLHGDNYKFSVVCLKQPTTLYIIAKQKLLRGAHHLGQHVFGEFKNQARLRLRFRQHRMSECNPNPQSSMIDSGNGQNDNQKEFNAETLIRIKKLLNEQLPSDSTSFVTDALNNIPIFKPRRSKFTVVKEQYKRNFKIYPLPPPTPTLQFDYYRFKLPTVEQGALEESTHEDFCRLTRRKNFYNSTEKRFEAYEPSAFDKVPDKAIHISSPMLEPFYKKRESSECLNRSLKENNSTSSPYHPAGSTASFLDTLRVDNGEPFHYSHRKSLSHFPIKRRKVTSHEASFEKSSPLSKGMTSKPPQNNELSVQGTPNIVETRHNTPVKLAKDCSFRITQGPNSFRETNYANSALRLPFASTFSSIKPSPIKKATTPVRRQPIGNPLMASAKRFHSRESSLHSPSYENKVKQREDITLYLRLREQTI